MSHETAHQALQALKNKPEALTKFNLALSELSVAAGIPIDDEEMTYLANALINQRLINANANIGQLPGSDTIGGFHIKAAIDVQ